MQKSMIWQKRFWEHVIRDEDDFKKHVEYVHYNPVKHGLANRVQDWPYSSFHEYVKKGVYPSNWGTGIDFSDSEQFGE